jgi:hypothetical protein
MGFLDEVGKVLDKVETATPIDIITGIKGAVTDAPNLVGDVAHGDFGQAFVDGRKVLGDGKDIALGLSSLGANLGPVASFTLDPPVCNMTESELAEEISLIGRLASQNARAGQHLLASGMHQQLGEDPVSARGYVEYGLGLPSAETVLADKAQIFATRYAHED